MLTDELCKGHRVLLRNGWQGVIADNDKGNMRTVQVEGDNTEIGSVYSYDIVAVKMGNTWIDLEHTSKQQKAKRKAEAYS